jgi:hypothetical protein
MAMGEEGKPTAAPATTTITPKLVSHGMSADQNPDVMPLEHCHGDCDNDGHCKTGYVCHQQDQKSPIPGCEGTPEEAMDYCVRTGDVATWSAHELGKKCTNKNVSLQSNDESAAKVICENTSGCAGIQKGYEGVWTVCMSTNTVAFAQGTVTWFSSTAAMQSNKWCNTDKTFVNGMQSKAYGGRQQCLAQCRDNAACQWVGYRVADQYCEFWTSGSCNPAHDQPGHDIYQVTHA